MAKSLRRRAVSTRMQQSKTLAPQGTGGETHQTAVDDMPILTTRRGFLSHDQNSLRLPSGTTTLKTSLRQKIFHFDHERIPERRPCPWFCRTVF